jgi:hypothetical protein
LILSHVHEKQQQQNGTEIVSYDNIIKLNKENLKSTIMQYLILQEIVSFGLTCKTFYKAIFEFKENEGQPTITKICSMDIPSYIVPHVTILKHINKSCSVSFF